MLFNLTQWAEGGVSVEPFAVIHATFPAGSTCNCTKGQTTLFAPPGVTEYLFLIPEAGTWTVSCTDGTRTTSQNVVIDSQYQVENVVLAYSLVIFDYTTFVGVVGDVIVRDGSYGNLRLTADNELQITSSGDLGGRAKTVNSYEKGSHSFLKITSIHTAVDRKFYLKSTGGTILSTMNPGSSASFVTDVIFDLSEISVPFVVSMPVSTIRRIWME